MKELILHKQNGEGTTGFVVSYLVISAMAVVMLFFIQVSRDVYTKIQIDQVARAYALRMESVGYLTSEMQTDIKTDLKNIKAVNDSVKKGNEIKLTGSTTSRAPYGDVIKLKIQCPASVAYWVPSKYESSGIKVFFGGIRRKSKVFNVVKETTSKYSNITY